MLHVVVILALLFCRFQIRLVCSHMFKQDPTVTANDKWSMHKKTITVIIRAIVFHHCNNSMFKLEDEIKPKCHTFVLSERIKNKYCTQMCVILMYWKAGLPEPPHQGTACFCPDQIRR